MSEHNVIHHMTAVDTISRDNKYAIWFKITEDDNYGKRKNWYPQRISLNAFIKRHNFKHETAVWNSSKPWKEDYIIVECTSVWDFFEKIGYDYKTKKFIDQHKWRNLYNGK